MPNQNREEINKKIISESSIKNIDNTIEEILEKFNYGYINETEAKNEIIDLVAKALNGNSLYTESGHCKY